MASTGGTRPWNVTGGSVGFNTSPEDAIDGGKKNTRLAICRKRKLSSKTHNNCDLFLWLILDFSCKYLHSLVKKTEIFVQF
jgi:hypothetical protein